MNSTTPTISAKRIDIAYQPPPRSSFGMIIPQTSTSGNVLKPKKKKNIELTSVGMYQSGNQITGEVQFPGESRMRSHLSSADEDDEKIIWNQKQKSMFRLLLNQNNPKTNNIFQMHQTKSSFLLSTAPQTMFNSSQDSPCKIPMSNSQQNLLSVSNAESNRNLNDQQELQHSFGQSKTSFKNIQAFRPNMSMNDLQSNLVKTRQTSSESMENRRFPNKVNKSQLVGIDVLDVLEQKGRISLLLHSEHEGRRPQMNSSQGSQKYLHQLAEISRQLNVQEKNCYSTVPMFQDQKSKQLLDSIGKKKKNKIKKITKQDNNGDNCETYENKGEEEIEGNKEVKEEVVIVKQVKSIGREQQQQVIKKNIEVKQKNQLPKQEVIQEIGLNQEVKKVVTKIEVEKVDENIKESMENLGTIKEILSDKNSSIVDMITARIDNNIGNEEDTQINQEQEEEQQSIAEEQEQQLPSISIEEIIVQNPPSLVLPSSQSQINHHKQISYQKLKLPKKTTENTIVSENNLPISAPLPLESEKISPIKPIVTQQKIQLKITSKSQIQQPPSPQPAIKITKPDELEQFLRVRSIPTEESPAPIIVPRDKDKSVGFLEQSASQQMKKQEPSVTPSNRLISILKKDMISEPKSQKIIEERNEKVPSKQRINTDEKKGIQDNLSIHYTSSQNGNSLYNNDSDSDIILSTPSSAMEIMHPENRRVYTEGADKKIKKLNERFNDIYENSSNNSDKEEPMVDGRKIRKPRKSQTVVGNPNKSSKSAALNLLQALTLGSSKTIINRTPTSQHSIGSNGSQFLKRKKKQQLSKRNIQQVSIEQQDDEDNMNSQNPSNTSLKVDEVETNRAPSLQLNQLTEFAQMQQNNNLSISSIVMLFAKLKKAKKRALINVGHEDGGNVCLADLNLSSPSLTEDLMDDEDDDDYDDKQFEYSFPEDEDNDKVLEGQQQQQGGQEVLVEGVSQVGQSPLAGVSSSKQTFQINSQQSVMPSSTATPISESKVSLNVRNKLKNERLMLKQRIQRLKKEFKQPGLGLAEKRAKILRLIQQIKDAIANKQTKTTGVEEQRRDILCKQIYQTLISLVFFGNQLILLTHWISESLDYLLLKVEAILSEINYQRKSESEEFEDVMSAVPIVNEDALFFINLRKSKINSPPYLMMFEEQPVMNKERDFLAALKREDIQIDEETLETLHKHIIVNEDEYGVVERKAHFSKQSKKLQESGFFSHKEEDYQGHIYQTMLGVENINRKVTPQDKDKQNSMCSYSFRRQKLEEQGDSSLVKESKLEALKKKVQLCKPQKIREIHKQLEEIQQQTAELLIVSKLKTPQGSSYDKRSSEMSK